MNPQRFLIVTLPLLLSGCSLAPDFTLPDIAVPETFREAPKAPASMPTPKGDYGTWKLGEPAPAQTGGEWWKIFGDETLNALQTEAATGNQSVAAMAARVEQSRALIGIATSNAFPDIAATGGSNRYKPSTAIPGMSGAQLKPLTTYTGNLGLSFETNLLGSVIDQRGEAIANAEAADATLASVRLAMQADVAQTYFALRSADAELKLLNETLELREKGLDILRKRLDIGTIGELDIKRDEVEVEQTRTQMLIVSQQRKELEHALALLVGKAPSQLAIEGGAFEYVVPIIPAGLPSSLLERRPDVIAAQHTLAAANHRIGLARAAFFPRIALTASRGYESTEFDNMFKWPSRIWSVGPLVTIPLFEGGRNIAGLERSKAAYKEATANYRQQVLVAFRDVEDNLSRLQSLEQQSQSQDIAAGSATRASGLLRSRYDVGDVSYIEWADARRSELLTRRQQIAIQRDRLNATVQLIRALGGGWASSAPADTSELSN